MVAAADYGIKTATVWDGHVLCSTALHTQSHRLLLLLLTPNMLAASQAACTPKTSWRVWMHAMLLLVFAGTCAAACLVTLGEPDAGASVC
jgi:hypothetical protein